jgi:hypothetical protein
MYVVARMLDDYVARTIRFERSMSHLWMIVKGVTSVRNALIAKGQQ